MVSLNLIKPLSLSQARIAKKCNWKNLDDIPVRKCIISDRFSGTAKFEPGITTVSERLNPNNFEVLDFIMRDDKLSRSPFVRRNLSQILSESKTEEGAALMQKILTPETVDKLDFQRTLVKNYPRDYIKDKTMVKYIASPAGLNTLFNDISMLKAAYIMDKKTLNALFKLDITTGRGKSILNDIGKFNFEQLQKAGNNLKDPQIRDFVLSEKKFVLQ